MSKIVKLSDFFSSFCTRRSDAGFEKFIFILSDELCLNKNVIIDRSGITYMSLSFFDEIYLKLFKSGLSPKQLKLLSFTPDLEASFLDQAKRRLAAIEK